MFVLGSCLRATTFISANAGEELSPLAAMSRHIRYEPCGSCSGMYLG